MKFEEIAIFLEQGKRVRRRSWDSGYLYVRKECGIISDRDNLAATLTCEDILARDWEIVFADTRLKEGDE